MSSAGGPGGMSESLSALLLLGLLVLLLLLPPMAALADDPAPPGMSALPGDGDSAALAARRLTLPLPGLQPQALTDTFSAARSEGRQHDAIDIPAPAGTPVLAVEDGRIAKLFLSQPGGITIYQFDPTGRYSYYYAHLQGYAEGLREGQQVRRGQVIGYVGDTGNARGGPAHLHFAIARLPPEQSWWKGEALNPYPVLRAGIPKPTSELP
ncbi:M23 family metallopeptidase [Melaminivora jejuensis]|uniref:M23 family metallopeptidase n=1 Tax=Melaminivora jejuensis TaxID=1267217 RepID=UPI001E629D45|nr:M23 family metallopeptidase [Melaminivora jejuensis]UHJ64846.1 M23 family metallopeptidase [Melaminivora jejuensis]